MHNLVTYYLLPLAGVNFCSFGSYQRKSNLKSVKLDIKNLKLICFTYNIANVHYTAFNVAAFDKKIENDNIIIYNFPARLTKTIKAFVTGKYSTIPGSIKQHIKKNSGLPATHDIILGLDKDPRLKKYLEEKLNIIIEDHAELLEAPKKEWFL